VVGDVSGRGAEAAALMGRLRFTLRAYLLEGHPPEVALGLTSRQLDIIEDGRLATVLVGTGDLRSRTLTLANAGHLSPLVITDGQAHFLPTTVGPPLGVGIHSYPTTVTTMRPGSTLLAFTDGLVERRTEALDVGLDRLLTTARMLSGPLDDQCAALLAGMTQSAGEDDVALLAFRWTPVPALAVPEEPDAAAAPAPQPA
jgi:serine phosphatase RsbU (regulator of sigma subunit)